MENELKSREQCCCFTGHRFISAEHRARIDMNLPDIIRGLATLGITDFIAGGALGFDTIAAQAVIAERKKNPDIRLILALPCREQYKRWSKRDTEAYHAICSAADRLWYISEEYYNGCMQKRNRAMADHSSHCIFYMNTPRGGTAYTVKYALSCELEMHNVLIPYAYAV